MQTHADIGGHRQTQTDTDTVRYRHTPWAYTNGRHQGIHHRHPQIADTTGRHPSHTPQPVTTGAERESETER